MSFLRAERISSMSMIRADLPAMRSFSAWCFMSAGMWMSGAQFWPLKWRYRSRLMLCSVCSRIGVSPNGPRVRIPVRQATADTATRVVLVAETTRDHMNVQMRIV